MTGPGTHRAGDLVGRVAELEDTVRDLAFALEVICSRIPPDETHLSGHESTAYQALVKYPEWVQSRHVRALMGLDLDA